MLVKALEEFIQGSSVYRHNDYTLYAANTISCKRSLKIFTKSYTKIVLDLKDTTVPLKSILQTLNEHYSTDPYRKYKKIRCIWYVCSTHGGIYLYETLDVKEAKKSGKMKNSFIIMNTDNGTVSFGPGHTYNKEFSERLGKILRSSRFFTREKWLEQLYDIFTLSEVIREKRSI